jgi:hypothetical protein
MTEKFRAILVAHVGKIFGSVMGLFLGWIIIRYGVIRGLFVALCVAVGFYVGARLDSPGTSTDITSRFLR